jgi:hypothetical protein
MNNTITTTEKLSNQFIKNNMVNGKYQRVVMYCGDQHVIDNITEKNIMLRQLSKLGRGNCGRFNSGRYRIQNTETSIDWYLENRVIV